ncbi:MAG: methylmalonyl Co-A mutase-associated GTPase MeaB [Bacteroidetes bacterium]|nr:MAG: methylmalonyl Co-A mutase-associated GTPase MeaB [Bacteroidota bacterium]
MNKKKESALKVNKGIKQPPSVNNDAVKKLQKKRKKEYSVSEYVEGIIKGDRSILSQAITLIESSLPKHQIIAQEIIAKCLPYSGNSIRIGITGVPGVGKSTFIEAIGKEITSTGGKLAVLAIDPSSERSKGSILGDKTRMEALSSDKNAYIRPSPSAGSLGGVARKTRETVVLCEAAGFDTIFIETVGVGQSETAVHSMVDFFLLLMLAGAGDELQGMKRGIMEMADVIAINKAEGDNINKANLAKVQYQNALHLFPPKKSNWIAKATTCSAISNKGISHIWAMINDYKKLTKENNFFMNNRREQSKYWMYETINDNLKFHFYNNEDIINKLKLLEKKVLIGEISSFYAAKILIDDYYKLKA